jgi:hypothetical protein
MKFTNAELCKRKREGKSLRGLKEIRGVYVNLAKLDETVAKQAVKELITKLEGEGK